MKYRTPVLNLSPWAPVGNRQYPARVRKSSGSVANVLEMLKLGKKVVVYFAPEMTFYTVTSEDDVRRLIGKCDDDAISEISRKVKLTGTLREITQKRQSSLAL